MEPTCWWGDRLLADHQEWGEVLCKEMLHQWVGRPGGWRGCIFTGGSSLSGWHAGEDSEERGLAWQVSGGECSSYKEQLCKGPAAGWCLVCFHDKKMGHRLTHTHTHTHTHTQHTYRYIHRYTEIYTRRYTHRDTHIHAHIYTHAQMHAHIHRDTYMHIHIHIDTHIYLHTYIHTHKEMGHRLTYTQTHRYTAQPGARL